MKFKNRREEILTKAAEAEKAQQDAQKQAEMSSSYQRVTPNLHADHRMPSTRRELLSAGLIGGMSYVFAPTFLSMMQKKAYGLECKDVSGAGGGANAMPGFLTFEFSGGWSAAMQAPPGKNRNATFEPIAAQGYASLALGTNQIPPAINLTNTFGGNTFVGKDVHPQSRFFQGMMSVMSPEAAAKLGVAIMPCQSGDDTRNNRANVTEFVARVQGDQGALASLAGSGQSSALGRTASAFEDPSLARATVADESNLTNLVDPGLLATLVTKNGAIEITKAASKLSETKLASLNEKLMSQQVKDLVQCGYLGSADLLTEFTEDRLRPSLDATITTGQYGTSGQTAMQLAAQNEANQQAIIMGKLLSEGLVSAGTIEMGGYDYHGRGRAQQDDRDLQAGVAVGLALETAHRRGGSLFIACVSDGSVSSRGTGGVDGRFDFSADSGTRGMTIMLALGAAAAPEMIRPQIGAFADSGAVDTSYLVTSNSAQLAAFGVAYNYAAFSGRMSQFATEMASIGVANPFNEQEYLGFAPKA